MAVELKVIQGLLNKMATSVPVPGQSPEALVQKQKTADTLAAAADQATKGVSSTGASPSIKPIKTDDSVDTQGGDQAAVDQEKQQRAHMAEIAKKDKEIAALQHQLDLEKVHREQVVSERAIQDKAKAESANIEKQKRELEEQRKQLEQDKALQDNMSQAELVRHQADMEKETAKQQAAIAQDKAKAMGDIAQQNAQQYIKTTEQGRKSVDKYLADQRKAQQQSYVSPALQGQMNRALQATSRLGANLNKLAAYHPVPGSVPAMTKTAANMNPAGAKNTTAPASTPASVSATTPSQQPAAGNAARPAAATPGQNPVVVNKQFDYGFDTTGMSQSEIDTKAYQQPRPQPQAAQSQQTNQPANFTRGTAANLPQGFKFTADNVVSSDPRGFTVYRYGGQLYSVPTSQVVKGTGGGSNQYLNAYNRGKGTLNAISAADVLNNSVYYNGSYLYAGAGKADNINSDSRAKALIEKSKNNANAAYERNAQLGDQYVKSVAGRLDGQNVAQRQVTLAQMEGQYRDNVNNGKLREGSQRANNVLDSITVGNGLVKKDIRDVKNRAANGDKEAQREYSTYLAQNKQQVKQDDGFWKNFAGIDTNYWSSNPETESMIENLRRGTAPTNWAGTAGALANFGLGMAANYFVPGLGYAVWAAPTLIGGVTDTNNRINNAKAMQKTLSSPVTSARTGASYTPDTKMVNELMQGYGLDASNAARYKGYAGAAGSAAIDAGLMYGTGKLSKFVKPYFTRWAAQAAVPKAAEMAAKTNSKAVSGAATKAPFWSKSTGIKTLGFAADTALAGGAFELGGYLGNKAMDASGLHPYDPEKVTNDPEQMRQQWDYMFDYKPWYTQPVRPIPTFQKDAAAEPSATDKMNAQNGASGFNTRFMNSPQGHNIGNDFNQVTAWPGVRDPYKDTPIGRFISSVAPYVEMASGGAFKLKPSYSPYKTRIPVFNSPQAAVDVMQNTEMDPRLSTKGRYLTPLHQRLANNVANANQGGYSDYSASTSGNIFSMPSFT